MRKRGTVELEPARGATLWQATAGDDDVGIAARCREGQPVDPVATADREQPPAAPVAHNIGDAGIPRAARETLFL